MSSIPDRTNKLLYLDFYLKNINKTKVNNNVLII